MRVPLEISFRGVEKTEFLENLIREKTAKLERLCDNIISCRISSILPGRGMERKRSNWELLTDLYELTMAVLVTSLHAQTPSISAPQAGHLPFLRLIPFDPSPSRVMTTSLQR